MTPQEIKQQLSAILAKINDNGISAWDADLEESREAVALEDHYGDQESNEPTTVYNGWLEDLSQLIEKL